MTKQLTQGLGGITLVVIAAAAALLLFASTALAAGTVVGETKTVAAGGQAVVKVQATNASGGIGSWTIDVAVPAGTLGTPTCANLASGGDCNVIGNNTVRFAGSVGSASGLTGTVDIGTVTVTAGSSLAAGQCADLVITAGELNDQLGAAINPTVTNGKVCVQAAATSPAVTPSPTAAQLPSTGGPTDSSGPSSLVWLLAAAGLIVVSSAAWALSRARREI